MTKYPDASPSTIKDEGPPVSPHAPGQIDREIDTRRVLAIGGGIGLATVVACIAMFFLFRVFLAGEVRKDVPVAPLIAESGPRTPPEPHLQTFPERDLQTMRAAETAALTSYAWVDRDSGVVRIPIARAMELVVREGLPARSAPDARKGSP
jgi:hypothetical protein